MRKTQIVSIFSDEVKLLGCIKALQEQKVDIDEVYMPYPVHEVIEALNRKSKFAYIAFLYGAAAVISILAFLYYTSVIDWPINYGGKPTNAFPSFIVITLVLTIFTVTILSLFTFSLQAKLYPGKKHYLPDDRATDDKFVMVFSRDKVGNRKSELDTILKENGAEEVYFKEQ
jgi:hypothetical protein